MCRHDGLPMSAATVLRLLGEEGLLLEASYQPRVFMAILRFACRDREKCS